MFKNLTYIGAFTLFVVIIWVAVVLYSSLTSTTIPGDVEKQINPLGKSFNSKALNNLKQRKKVPVDLSKLPPVPSVSPTINQPAQINLSPTPSGVSQQATSSGQVSTAQ